MASVGLLSLKFDSNEVLPYFTIGIVIMCWTDLIFLANCVPVVSSGFTVQCLACVAVGKKTLQMRHSS